MRINMGHHYKEYIAHSENREGIKQTMKEHSSGVAKLMREFALSESFADLYEFCGLIHDMGKYSIDFQEHITGANNRVRHAIYGSIFAKEKNLMEVALPIYGHHTGLPNCPLMLQDIKAELAKDKDFYESICKHWKEDTLSQIPPPNDGAFRDIPDIYQKELFVRMLFSSLVDADSLDTERHFSRERFSSRMSSFFNPEGLLYKLKQKLHSFQEDPEKKNLRINQLRNEVRLFAESKANLPQGCFSLTLPTGMGKTLCSINWALNHAHFHPNIKRIIIVLPFISIIDQTAEELKSIFNDKESDYVLEHHSNVVYDDNENNDDFSPLELATDNWDYPIIVTTSVQFFESLFSNKRSMCRKLHNIQDSILIFDEIQTLPLNITEPTLAMLNNLHQLCRCSILFCTATQPDFESRKGFCGINHIESLVDNPQRIFDETKRVIYQPLNDYNELTISELADSVLNEKKSALVVFNTKKKARLFYDEISGDNDHTVFHLSTSMCPVHRKETIRSIRDALKKKKTIIVCSTQLIEAGVDLDFPLVYRELAPLESIIQSAGRCNREGKSDKGNVYLFSLTEYGQPSKEYRAWIEFANMLYKGNEDILYTHDFYSYYYRELVKNFANTDQQNINEDRTRLLFQTIAEKYRIIENDTLSLFIYNYDSESKQYYMQIKDKEYLSKEDWQHISQYCVQVYNNFVRDNSSFIGYEPCGISVWHGSYSPYYGLPSIEDFSVLIK